MPPSGIRLPWRSFSGFLLPLYSRWWWSLPCTPYFLCVARKSY